MTELQGAVAVAQLGKLSEVVERRMRAAEYLSEQIHDLSGVTVPRVRSGDTHSFWKYILNVDPQIIPGGSVALARKLREEHGISSAPRYIQKPAFDCEIFRKQRTFGSSRFPFSLARPEAVSYRPESYPDTYAALERVLVLPWNEKYETRHLDFIASALRKGVANLCTKS
jgi:dTDP-4-amino-4,6-dideoxygalactose transaminase